MGENVAEHAILLSVNQAEQLSRQDNDNP